MRVLVSQLASRRLGPHHEGVHRALYVRLPLLPSVGTRGHGDERPVVSLQQVADGVLDLFRELLSGLRQSGQGGRGGRRRCRRRRRVVRLTLRLHRLVGPLLRGRGTGGGGRFLILLTACRHRGECSRCQSAYVCVHTCVCARG